METNLEKSAAFGNVLFEEKITKSSSSGEENHGFMPIKKRVYCTVEGENHRHIKQEDDSSKPQSPNTKDISTILIKEDHQIESAKAEMGEAKEENERLKLLLSQIVKDYQSLQMRFLDIFQQEEAKKSTKTAPSYQEKEESDLVSLSLGRSSGSEAKKEEKNISRNLISHGKEDEKPNDNEGLTLGLECRFEPPGSTEPENNTSYESSIGKPEEEEPTDQVWPPSKLLKTVTSGDHEEDVSEQMQLKKARVSVRARCDTPTMNDGCQWRKYGQKIAKGNPCPRAYYRCTASPTCPVRKQVQRCAEDMSILITTYEGNHNHPLPLSATAMASTTSAAASMLQSQSSSSKPGPGTSVSASSTSTSSAANLHGLNFNFAQNSRPYQYYFPNSSISTSNSHPTITLDLTVPANYSYFSRFSNVPKYSSACLNFSSPPSLEGSNPQTSWNTSHLTIGAFPNHKNSFIGPLNVLGRQPTQQHLYQSYMQMTNQTSSHDHQQSLSETITAATKAITSNPNFRSALAAALTSVVGNGGGVPRHNHSGSEGKWGESLKTAHPAAVENEVGCASSYLGKSSSMNPHQPQQTQESLLLFPTSLPFPTSKNASDPPPADFN